MRVVFFKITAIAAAQSWTPLTTGTTESLCGVSAPTPQIVFASGAKGTVLKSTDGGKSWRSISPRGVADLDFRDIKAVDEQTIYLLSSGKGQQSRIYKSNDQGASWDLLYTNPDSQGFLDCMGFWDDAHGIVIGDPVDGRFTILTTSDGATWQKQSKGPSANRQEGAFAASGTCLFTRGTREAWFGTGGVGGGRVFHTTDGGQTWSVAKTPMRHDSENAGVFSIAFPDAMHGIAVGGDYSKPDDASGNIAITEDGGKNWTVPSSVPHGYRSAVAYFGDVWIATGTSGSDWSRDGRTWMPFGEKGYNSFNRGFAIGASGKAALLVLPAQH